MLFTTDEAAGAAAKFHVLCRANGGPYDDDAFSSGWRLGELAATLAQPGIRALADSIRRVERQQADLIAMAYGYTMSIDSADGPDWLSVTFTRVSVEG
jgi:hypothetical protein